MLKNAPFSKSHIRSDRKLLELKALEITQLKGTEIRVIFTLCHMVLPNFDIFHVAESPFYDARRESSHDFEQTHRTPHNKEKNNRKTRP